MVTLIEFNRLFRSAAVHRTKDDFHTLPSNRSDVVASPGDWQSLQTNPLPVYQYISITNPLPLSRDVSSDKAEKRHHALDLGPVRSNGNETKLSTLCGKHKVVVDLLPEKATMLAGTSEA
jgi:hypothetical protein